MSETQEKKKRCYFWRIYKYNLDPDAISFKGWLEMCNEMYEIQHGKKRDRNIYVDPATTELSVKGRAWNKDKIEKWLDDHGYKWTLEIETRYQFQFTNPNDVIFVDADEGALKQSSAN